MPSRTSRRLELRRVPEEIRDLVLGAETHDALDTRPVVPGAVEQHDVALGRQLRDVALEVPLSALGLRRLGERDRARVPRVQSLEKARDAAALARRVAPFEEDDDALPRLLHIGLELQKLELERQ